MKRRMTIALASTVLATTATAAALAAVRSSAETGPSSSQTPYLLPSHPGVSTESILTVGDAAPNGYRMVGIPDGLGAFDNADVDGENVGDDGKSGSNNDGTFTLLMNQELGATKGIVRAHGSKGAFVSRWIIRKDDLSVVSGQDLMTTVYLWQNGAYVKGTSAFDRFCSADLADPAAFYDEESNTGYRGRILMNGEESGVEGRALAHLMDGTSYQLPYLGRMAWENAVANPGTGARTVVAGLDDGRGGQVYFYFGNKQAAGSPIEKAGLSGGTLYGLKVAGLTTETDASVLAPGTRFTLANLGDASTKTGAALDTQSVAAGVSTFQRPEDGSWDPANPHVFYFVTTASFAGKSRLWRATFDNPADPTAGGTVEMLLDGTEGQHMLDNITVTDRGQIIALEDVGNNPHIGKVWLYDPRSDTLTEIAHHDPNRFAVGGSQFLTQDEESSGVIPAPFLGKGAYLLDVQAHYTHPDGELVEGGQLLVLRTHGKLDEKK